MLKSAFDSKNAEKKKMNLKLRHIRSTTER